MQRISIIGLGRMGGALAIALSRAGIQVTDVTTRRSFVQDGIVEQIPTSIRLIQPYEKPSGDVVIIATGDPDIRAASERLSRLLSGTEIVLHTSGSLDSGVLADCSSLGCSVGSIHPLVSISEPVEGSKLFTGRYFCIEGDQAAKDAATAIATALGGEYFSIASEFKPLYHAAAVTSAGHVVALFSTAVNMLSKCGLAPEQARKVLLPLLESTVANLRSMPAAEALTGSFARGDLQAFERHLGAFKGVLDAETIRIFLDLGQRSVDLAASRSPDPAAMAALRARIDIAKSEL